VVATLLAWAAVVLHGSATSIVEPISLVVLAIGIALVVAATAVLRRALRPRIGATPGELHFGVGRGRYTSVPIDIVEAFFLGQGAAELPAGLPDVESVNLVARISQKAADWQRRDVDRRIAAWRDGYLTIRGTACEPLDADVVHRLNRLLAQANRDQRQAES